MGRPSYRSVLWMLREFEGPRCLWRVAAGGVLLILTVALPFTGFVAGAYLAGDLHSPWRVIAGALVAVPSGEGARRIGRREPWRALLTNRLRTYEMATPNRYLSVLTTKVGVSRALRALRRAKLNPHAVIRRGSPIDAPELTMEIQVWEPSKWAQSAGGLDLVARGVRVLQDAGVRARVAGRDVWPGGW